MFKSFKIYEAGVEFDFTVDECQWQEWVNQLVSTIRMFNGFAYTCERVFGKFNCTVRVVDPSNAEDDKHQFLTLGGRKFYDQNMAPSIKAWWDTLGIGENTKRIVEPVLVGFITDELIASPELKRKLAQQAALIEEEKYQNQTLTAIRSLAQQADAELGIEPLFFLKGSTIYYEYGGNLYKVPPSDVSPELGNTKHLVANKFVDF